MEAGGGKKKGNMTRSSPKIVAVNRLSLGRRSIPFLCVITTIVLCGLVLIGGLGVASAIAKPGVTVVPAGRYAALSLRGSNGVRLSLFVYARHVTLDAEQPRRQASVVYTVKGHSRRGRISTKFGRLGHVHMRWKPTSAFTVSREPQGNCRGRKPLLQRGVFVGRFVFRAEGSFTQARATRVPGLRVRSFRNVCHSAHAGSQPEETLLAAFQKEGQNLRFRASTRISGSERLEEFEANAAERVGALSIDRYVLTGGAPVRGEFSFDAATGSARVEPPFPFTGVGVLNETASAGVWTGDLAVNLPGLGRISLAGSGFEAQLSAQDGGLKPFGE